MCLKKLERQFLTGYHTQGIAQLRLKYTPVLDMKKFLFFLSWGQLTHPEAIERLSGHMGRGIHYIRTLTWHYLDIIVAH